MGSRMQIERSGESPPDVSPTCKSLGSYEAEWVTSKGGKTTNRHTHRQRGGYSNHGVKVEPGSDLNELTYSRSKSWPAKET